MVVLLPVQLIAGFLVNLSIVSFVTGLGDIKSDYSACAHTHS
jgi:hypothetical protein